MKKNEATFEQGGDELMKQIGAIEKATSDLKNDKETCQKVDPEEVGSWISAIGKALLAIFK